MSLDAEVSNTSSYHYTTPAVGHSSSASGPALPLDLEQTLVSLSSHRSVLGYMVLSRGHPISIIRHSGVIFEGEQGRKYAAALSRIVETVRVGLEEVGGDNVETDDIRFMRIRTKRHEIMLSPDERYILAVLNDPPSP